MIPKRAFPHRRKGNRGRAWGGGDRPGCDSDSAATEEEGRKEFKRCTREREVVKIWVTYGKALTYESNRRGTASSTRHTPTPAGAWAHLGRTSRLKTTKDLFVPASPDRASGFATGMSTRNISRWEGTPNFWPGPKMPSAG